jgi:hypothetical protein
VSPEDLAALRKENEELRSQVTRLAELVDQTMNLEVLGPRLTLPTLEVVNELRRRVAVYEQYYTAWSSELAREASKPMASLLH